MVFLTILDIFLWVFRFRKKAVRRSVEKIPMKIAVGTIDGRTLAGNAPYTKTLKEVRSEQKLEK